MVIKEKKKPDEIVYKGDTEKEKRDNIRMYTLTSNFLKRSAVELTHNEQYALIDGLSNFAVIKKPVEQSNFNLPEFRGETEKDKIENAVFSTLVQNVIQRFETRITEDEREALYTILMARVESKDK